MKIRGIRRVFPAIKNRPQPTHGRGSGLRPTNSFASAGARSRPGRSPTAPDRIARRPRRPPVPWTAAPRTTVPGCSPRRSRKSPPAGIFRPTRPERRAGLQFGRGEYSPVAPGFPLVVAANRFPSVGARLWGERPPCPIMARPLAVFAPSRSKDPDVFTNIVPLRSPPPLCPSCPI